MKKMLIFTLIISSLLLAACSATQATPLPVAAPETSDLVVAEGHLLPAQDVRLTFPVRGQVGEIPALEGQPVSAGAVLVRMADRQQAEAALTAANLELVQAQQAYDELIRLQGANAAQAWEAYQKAQIARAAAQKEWEAIDPNTIQDDIDTAQTDVRDKKKALEDAQDALAKYLDLKSDNPTRRQAEDDVRKAEAEYNDALRQVEQLQRDADGPRAALDAALAAETEAKRKYEMSKDSPDPDQKALLEARLDNARAQSAAAQHALENYDLKAPFAGVVTEVNVSLGQLVGTETWAVQMADFSAWHVETSDLTELEVVKVKPGQAVEIRPDALPDVVLKGVVESISQAYKTQGGDILYTVKISLVDTDPALRWGMTVEATFLP
jgi:multidrug resistance efflux pump